jgi:hypothetical protein
LLISKKLLLVVARVGRRTFAKGGNGKANLKVANTGRQQSRYFEQ